MQALFHSFRMPLFRLVTFDIKDTLIRVSGTVGQHYAKVAQSHGVLVEADALDKVYPPVWKRMKTEYPNYGINQGMTSKEWWADFVVRVFASAGVIPENGVMTQIGDTLYTRFTRKQGWDLYPNSHNILKSIKKKGIKMGVISNFDERLGDILKQVELDRYFDFVLTSVDVKREKPDAEIFHEALSLGKVEPSQAAHVGDNIMADYRGARNVGMTAFLLDRKIKYDSKSPIYEDVDKKYVINRLSDLDRFIH
jgi:REG-2-like HAD superfamily hydrolase